VKKIFASSHGGATAWEAPASATGNVLRIPLKTLALLIKSVLYLIIAGFTEFEFVY
jgi:hypothetical protein